MAARELELPYGTRTELRAQLTAQAEGGQQPEPESVAPDRTRHAESRSRELDLPYGTRTELRAQMAAQAEGGDQADHADPAGTIAPDASRRAELPANNNLAARELTLPYGTRTELRAQMAAQADAGRAVGHPPTADARSAAFSESAEVRAPDITLAMSRADRPAADDATEPSLNHWADARGMVESPNPDRIHLTNERIEHTLVGDREKGRGGHRHGSGIPDKTTFPPHWDDQKILAMILDVARNPDRAPVYQEDHRTWLARGTREDVHIVTTIRPSGSVRTGFPPDGKGVHRNDNDGNPVPLPWPPEE